MCHHWGEQKKIMCMTHKIKSICKNTSTNHQPSYFNGILFCVLSGNDEEKIPWSKLLTIWQKHFHLVIVEVSQNCKNKLACGIYACDKTLFYNIRNDKSYRFSKFNSPQYSAELLDPPKTWCQLSWKNFQISWYLFFSFFPFVLFLQTMKLFVEGFL